MVGSILEKAVVAVPGLVVLFGLVWAFLKYLKFRDQRFAKALETRDTQFAETMKATSEACHAVQDRSTEAIKHNTKALEANAKIQGQTLEALRRFNGR